MKILGIATVAARATTMHVWRLHNGDPTTPAFVSNAIKRRREPIPFAVR